MTFQSIYGVDFSGAKAAGRNTWIARAVPARGGKRLRLVDLHNLERLCGSAERDCSLKHLVELIGGSESALWGMDFPFGLPMDLLDAGTTWDDQLDLVTAWDRGAYDLGLWCVERTKAMFGKLHLRRTTDTDAKAPFDCYHYRIIYQTFHGMRDVLAPVARQRGTAVLPFQSSRLRWARRVVVESCPSSTLKRLGVPHFNYKQPAGGPLTGVRRRTRHRMFEGLSRHVEIPPRHWRVIMRNGGGDALDAVIAAVGAHQGFRNADHRAIARHPRFRYEGYLYV